MASGTPELADIFRTHGAPFLARYGERVTAQQYRVMQQIMACRTPDMGGHVRECTHCGHSEVTYNSCRNRHCPKCQASACARWMASRAAELLPVEYFHVVFTLPDAFNALALQNQRVV